MNVTEPILNKIREIEEQESIPNKRLFIYFLSLLPEKTTTYAFLINEFQFSDEEIEHFQEVLLGQKLVTKKMLPQKIIKVSADKFKDDASEVIEHLSKVSRNKIALTKSRLALITKLMSPPQSYPVKTFKRVNLYFNMKWSSDPTMYKYVRPETLYNSKFPIRAEEADNFFEEMQRESSSLQRIVDLYKNLYMQNHGIETSEIISLSIYDRLLFWLKHYKVEDIENTLSLIFVQGKYNKGSDRILLDILSTNFSKVLSESKNLQGAAMQRIEI